MLRTIILIVTIFSCVLIQAQTDSINRSAELHNNLKLSYLSSLIYPGISAGIEFPVALVKPGDLDRHLKTKSFIKEHFVAGNLNWYHHPGFHDNVYITAEWVMRRTRDKGLISEFSAGPGFSRTFLGGTTYRVDDNGDISVIKLAGYSYGLITFGGGLGYDLSKNSHLPLSILGKMNIISMVPYNSTIYVRPVFELVLRYNPGRLFMKKLKKSKELILNKNEN